MLFMSDIGVAVMTVFHPIASCIGASPWGNEEFLDDSLICCDSEIVFCVLNMFGTQNAVSSLQNRELSTGAPALVGLSKASCW